MMTMISLNSLVCQKGAQGVEKEETGSRRKAGPTGTPMLARRGCSQVQLGLRCRMRRTGENIYGGVGFHSTERAQGTRDQSYLLTIGIDRARIK